MVTEHERRDELAEALATQLAALVRRAMHDNNDFTLPEPVVEKLGLELGVQVGVGVPGWYEPENITRFGQRFVKAVGWSLRWPGQNQKVTRAVGQVLDQLHDVLDGNLNATNHRTSRPSPSRTTVPNVSEPMTLHRSESSSVPRG